MLCRCDVPTLRGKCVIHSFHLHTWYKHYMNNEVPQTHWLCYITYVRRENTKYLDVSGTLIYKRLSSTVALGASTKNIQIKAWKITDLTLKESKNQRLTKLDKKLWQKLRECRVIVL